MMMTTMTTATNQENSLTVCTFNVWGLYVSPNRRVRMQAIAERLSKTNFDIITLQELWIQKDYQLLKNKLQTSYPYSHRFHSGILGSGLAIFSRHEIVNLNFYSYRLNGNPLYITHGDWYVGKGVGYARIRHPKQYIDLFVSHMIANYHSQKDEMDIYSVHRCSQMMEFCNFINQCKEQDCLTIATGDLNIEPSNLMYQEIFEKGMFLTGQKFSLRSIWRDCHVQDSATFNRNTSSYHNKAKAAECIDYILYDPSKSRCDKVELYLTERIGNNDSGGPSYSDHCAVVATFAFEPTDNPEFDYKSSLGEYYHQRAQDYMQMLKGRQDLLQIIATVSIGMALFLFITSSLHSSESDNSRQFTNTFKYLLLIPAFLLLSTLVCIHSNLWLRHEINVLSEVTEECSLWLRQKAH